MKIVKSETFAAHYALTKFINQQNIQREDILTIVTEPGVSSSNYVIFFYGDPNVELPKKGFWDL
ncbi:hypothetical protein [Mucilaginibacter sp. HD30]